MDLLDTKAIDLHQVVCCFLLWDDRMRWHGDGLDKRYQYCQTPEDT